MNEVGPVTTVGSGRNDTVGGHQPTAFVVIDSDTTELWHQGLLPADQRTEALYLRRSTALGFKTLDETEQEQRALPDNAFGIGRERLGKVQPVDVHLLQHPISRGNHLPEGQ